MNFKAALLGFFGDVGRFLAILFKQAVHDELKIVLPLAAKAVAAVAADPSLATSSEKRNAAIDQILAELAKAQISVGVDIVRLAIEISYQGFKDANPSK